MARNLSDLENFQGLQRENRLTDEETPSGLAKIPARPLKKFLCARSAKLVEKRGYSPRLKRLVSDRAKRSNNLESITTLQLKIGQRITKDGDRTLS